MSKPCLKIVGLHIEGLRALRRIDWPADGLGWGGKVPDLVLVGGVNGSGKTTLLEFLFHCPITLREGAPQPCTFETNAWVDFDIGYDRIETTRIRLVIGDDAFVDRYRTAETIVFRRKFSNGHGWLTRDTTSPLIQSIAHDLATFEQGILQADIPAVIALPSERPFQIPDTSYKAAGRTKHPREFAYRFKPAKEWNESLEAVLYSARWEDLNAKEEGHPERATHFASYTQAFEAFFEGSKQLVWDGGELFVRVADTGRLHPLSELSSGEKQMLLFCAELLRRWRPGSLILIDEPELHFHLSWQTKLLSMLLQWQKERGGQVIMATQSNHLFSIAEPGTKVILSAAGLA